MIYREIALPVAMRRFALCAWRFLLESGDPPAVQHQVPPDGTAGFVLTRGADGALHSFQIGPTFAATNVPVFQGYAYAGLRLRPDMAQVLPGVDAPPGSASPRPPDGTLAPVWRDLAALIDGACDWAGTAALWHATEPGDDVVAAAVDRLIASGGAWSVARLAAASRLSERQFRRRFQTATGITPKQYADVQRVRRALILALDDPDWSGIAHDSGFADQSHLTRDMRARFGRGACRVAGYFRGIRHELLEPADGRNLQAEAA